jgi:cytosine/adenosine deaminase-related metal-dependent hydrolase
VGVDQPRQEDTRASVDERNAGRHVVERRHALDPPVRDADAGLARAVGRHHPAATDHEFGSVHDRIVARARTPTLTAVRTVLRGARWPGDVAVRDGRIEAVGSMAEEPGDEVIRCDGDLVTAGLVNTHHHLDQWMTRGRCVGCDLFGWLVELYPVWGRLDVADVRAAALVGLAELALTGCTTAADHHYLVPRGDDTVFDAIVDAARTVGIRLHLARGSMDLGESRGGLPPDYVVEDIDAILASTESVIARHHDGERVVVTVAPCSPFSVTPELMRESAALARRHGLRLHTHLAETVDEERDVLERFGRRPVDLLDDLGWIDRDVWVAHGIHFDDAEVARLGAAGTGVAHCPSSNARLGAGMCRVVDLEAAGVPVGLGVDGAASNEAGGLQPELRQALYTARQRAGRADVFMPPDALRLATEGGARCLGRDDIGVLEPGYRADLVVWPGDDLGDVPDPLAGLVLGPDRRARHVLVEGEPVVRDGVLLGADEGALRRDLAERARRLWP